MFELFDPKREFTIRDGHLPHWYQAGVTYFVTFRTADSVPQKLARNWHVRRDVWLRQHGVEPSRRDWKTRLRQEPALERDFHAKFTRQFMEYLDHGYGACILRDDGAAELVGDALRHFDGQRYVLGDFIVMPNHVHALVCLTGATEIEAQCKSWKSYSAREINLLTGRQGRYWQEESFDHLVRSPEQFERFQRYIAENAAKAGLHPGQYLHWVRPK